MIHFIRTASPSAGEGKPLLVISERGSWIRRMETFFFQFELPEMASSAEIVLLLEKGDGFPVLNQLLNRFGLTVSNAELHRLRS